MTLVRLCALVLGALFALGASAQIYRWTDANGRTMIGERPPAGAKAKLVGERNQPEVVMYATSWCPWCAKARDYFARNGVRYTEHDIEKSAAANAEHKRLGGRGIPFIVVGGEKKIYGYSELALDAAINGDPKRR